MEKLICEMRFLVSGNRKAHLVLDERDPWAILLPRQLNRVSSLWRSSAQERFAWPDCLKHRDRTNGCHYESEEQREAPNESFSRHSLVSCHSHSSEVRLF